MKNQFRPTVLLASLGGALLLLTGCGEPSTASYSNAAGTLALSRDDAFLYAVDSDSDLVVVMDTATDAVVGQVRVGRAPERIVVGPDDTIYVSNRGSRSVSVIKRGAGAWAEVTQLAVGVEPVGMAVSPDNQTLYVVNSTSLDSPEKGTLTAIDVKTLQTRWDLAVGEEPRGVTLINGNRALVTLYKRGDVVTVDLLQGSVLTRNTDLYTKANASALTSENSFGGIRTLPTFHPRAMGDAVVTPDGRRAFVPTVWARENSLATTPPGGPGGPGGGSDYSGGPCGVGGVATAGLATFEASAETTTPQADDLGRCDQDPDKDFPPTALMSPTSDRGIQGPAVAVVDSTGSWLFVVNKETNNVAVLPASSRQNPLQQGMQSPGFDGMFGGRTSAIRSLVQVGAGPNGIALTQDGKKAYVYNSFDHTVSKLVQVGTGSTAQVVTSGRPVKVAEDTLSAEAAAGRRLFFSAGDSRMTASTTVVSCATCHLEAREDGHVWIFPDGPRQTPSLAGRMITSTAPFHWNGEFNTLADFLDETVIDRMGGTGATAEMGAQLAAFIDTLPTPENPLRTGSPTEAQLRGAQAFQKAECHTCHAGQALTDNTFHDVGTMVLTGPNPDSNLTLGLNVPSLLGISRTAPYLHDGSASSLRERIVESRYSDRHGKVSLLNNTEVDDLVEYLKTL